MYHMTKMETPKEEDDLGSPGAGKYGSSFGNQIPNIMTPVQEKLIDLVKGVQLDKLEPIFNIGDYGCADGLSSLTFLKDLLHALKLHFNQTTQFQIIYEDLPSNDFSSLFSRLHSNNCSLNELDDVFVLASGTNMYRQCVPDNSMYFIMSVLAAHWASGLPTKFEKSLWVYPGASCEERDAVRDHGRHDLNTYLLHRNKELKSGGILFISCFGIDESNCKIRSIFAKTFLEILTRVWKSFLDLDKISKKEFLDTNLPVYPFDLGTVKEAFDLESSVAIQGLELLSVEVKTIPCIFYQAWKQKKEKHGLNDRQEFARKYTAAHWNWSHAMFYSALSLDRSEEEKKKIIDEFYDEVENEIRETDPEDFKNDMIFCYVVIRKELRK